MARGLIVCFITGGKRVNSDTTNVVDKIVTFFLFLFFYFHVLLFAILGEKGRRKGGGVTWYLLVAIPYPAVISLSSPGMMGVLDVAGRQERFSV